MLVCGGRQFDLSKRCVVMGVLNVTPVSLSDGGLYVTLDAAVAHAEKLFADGADIVDIGGESTRPFSTPIDTATEMQRVLPVVKELVRRGMRELSIDTRRAQVAHACLAEGASWINDVSALTHDQDMVNMARNADAVVLMHARGAPETMQLGEINYDDVVQEVAEFFRERVAFCEANNISRDKIIVDPGIGFGKRLAHNLALLRGLKSFQGIGAGVLSGVSRKYFIGELTGIEDPAARDNGTLGAVAHSVLMGANIVRVHNVKATLEMLKVFETLLEQA